MPEVRNTFVNWTFQNAEKRKPTKKAWDNMITTFEVRPMPSSPPSPQRYSRGPSKMDLAFVLN